MISCGNIENKEIEDEKDASPEYADSFICLENQCANNQNLNTWYFDSERDRSGLKNNIAIYLIDTGFDLRHPQFKNLKPYNVFSADSKDKNININDYENCSFHGTKTLSLITGSSTGYFDDKLTKLVLVELSKCEKFSWNFENLITALEFIENHKKFHKIKKAVVNMSFGNPISKINSNQKKNLKHTILRLINQNIFFVAAAGNNGSGLFGRSPYIDDYYPTFLHSNKGFLVVGSSNQEKIPMSFTNIGADFFGPGEELVVADIIYTDRPLYGLSYSSATSTSAALISSLAAKKWQDNPDLSPQDLEDHIYSLADECKSMFCIDNL